MTLPRFHLYCELDKAIQTRVLENVVTESVGHLNFFYYLLDQPLEMLISVVLSAHSALYSLKGEMCLFMTVSTVSTMKKTKANI